MPDFRQIAIDLADKARELHTRERMITLESVDIIGEMDRWNASVYLMLDVPRLAARVALSEDQYLKRRQASRVLKRFPQFRELVVKGETTITAVAAVAILAPKVTPANVGLLLEGIRGKTTKQVAAFVKRVSFGGVLAAAASKQGQSELLDKAMQAAAKRGRKVSRRQIMEEALAMWLDEWDDEPAEATPTCAASMQATTVPADVSASAALTQATDTPARHAPTQRSGDIDGLPFDWWLSLIGPTILHSATG